MPILSIASLSILIGKPAPCLLPYFREVFFFLPLAHPPMALRRLSSGIAALEGVRGQKPAPTSFADAQYGFGYEVAWWANYADTH